MTTISYYKNIVTKSSCHQILIKTFYIPFYKVNSKNKKNKVVSIRILLESQHSEICINSNKAKLKSINTCLW